MESREFWTCRKLVFLQQFAVSPTYNKRIKYPKTDVNVR